MERKAFLVVGVLSLLFSAGARASLLTFDYRPNGTIIKNQYIASDGVTISADNFTPGHPDLAILFDTSLKKTNDADLEEPWDGGNRKTNHFKNILIIAENAVDKNKDGLIDRPDDEGQHRPAGYFNFKFSKPHSIFGLDLLDIEGASEIAADRGYISFRSGGVEKARVSFGAFVDPTSLFYDPTVKYGNNTANHIKPINVGDLRLTSFDEVRVNMGWSSAIDNIYFSDGINSIIPEPSCLTLAAAPLLFAMRRRKKS